MSYRTILLELRDEPESTARTRVAFALARGFGAEVIGIHVAPLPTVPAGFGVGSAYVNAEMIEALHDANRTVQERVRSAFAAAREPDVPARELFLEDLYGAALSHAARTADLTVLGPAQATGLAAPAEPVDEVLVQAGGPVLVLPPEECHLPAARALVAWNGSRQAARAMKDALPLLGLAEDVVVLTLGDGAEGSLEAAAAMLVRHGVKARAERRPESGPAGEQIQAVAAELGAGLVVMGAYSHSRLREAVFGGATREALGVARLPVLFSF